MEFALKVASKRYSANHIAFLKITFQYGKLLGSMDRDDYSLRVLRELEEVVE